MRAIEMTEGYAAVYGRTGQKVTRKFRCTTGARSGRVVANPATCNKPINFKKSQKLAITKRSRPSMIKYKANRAKQFNPASKRLAGVQKIRPRKTRKV